MPRDLSQMRLRRCVDARAGERPSLVLQQLLARLASGRIASGAPAAASASLDDLIARTGLRRDEVVTLADIGALNSFGYDRRSALWQAERAVRPSGELFTTVTMARDTRASRELAER